MLLYMLREVSMAFYRMYNIQSTVSSGVYMVGNATFDAECNCA